MDGIAELLAEPKMLSGASDAGAHIQIMCAAGEATYALTEHVRDSERLSIEDVVHFYTQQQAHCWGIGDRGVIAPGHAADLAVFKTLPPSSTRTISPFGICPVIPGATPRLPPATARRSSTEPPPGSTGP